MKTGLTGARVLVTGASRGIGYAIAAEFAREGAHVALCGRDAEAVEHAVRTLRDECGDHADIRVEGTALDVADTERLRAWIDHCAERFDGLDVFVPTVSAGGGPDKWREGFALDVSATVAGVESALTHMRAAGRGSIVLINSTSAVERFRGASAYAFYKAGLINYAKNLSAEVGPAGIRVNTVSPGPVMFAGGVWDRIATADPDYVRAVIDDIPLRRMMDPADVARAVVFLAGDAASGVTGAVLTVDGGFTRRIAG